MADLSPGQRASLRRCIAAAEADQWVRAEGNGERVTLASLYRSGLVDRRAWRGAAGEANAAYEYRASDLVMKEWRRRTPVPAKADRAPNAFRR